MQRRIDHLAAWGVVSASMLLASCDQTPVASVKFSPASTSPAQSAAAVAPAKTGFSLPIGGDIEPPTVPTAIPSASGSPFGRATMTIPLQSPPLPGALPRTPANAGSPAGLQTPPIQLSAGIAVPQSLPTGTAIGVSVDYRVVGSFTRSSHYRWIVKSAAGEATSEVQLESSGTLAAFFLELKPEHRPFTVRIEEVSAGSQRRVVISNELPLKTDY